MKSFAFALVAAVLAMQLATQLDAQPIQVLRLRSQVPNTFTFGDSCAFETTLPAVPVRLRLIRGTRDELIAYGRDPLNRRAGCVEYYSLIVRPFRDGHLLDLGFFLRESWLNGRANGRFVVVAEADGEPDGPRWELDRLRLTVGTPAQYFEWAIDVTVLAPQHIVVAGSGGGGDLGNVATTVGCVEFRVAPQPPASFQARSATATPAVMPAGVD